MSNRGYLAGAICILWVALALRTTDLYSLPLYHDEGDHLRWAQYFEAGNPNYPIFMDGKFLLGVILAQFQVNGPESIWVARAAVAVFSALACSASLALGTILGGKRAGWLAGSVYAILPLAVFYDRQIMADSLEAAFGAAAVVCALRAGIKGSGRWIFGLGTSLALAFSAKFYGLLFFAYPVLAGFFFAASRRSLLQHAGRYLAAVALAFTVTAGIFYSLRPRLGYDNGLMARQKVGHITCPPLLCEGDIAKQLGYYSTALHSLAEFVPVYAGWPLAALACASWVLAPPDRRRRVGLIVTATVGMLAGFASVAYILPARYLVFLSLPLSALGAAGGLWAVERFRPGWARFGAAAALLAVNAWPTLNLSALLTHPDLAVLPYDDRVNYITGPISGTYMLQAARDIMAREAQSPAPPVLIFAHGFKEQLNQLLVHFDVTKVQAFVIDDVRLRDVGRWLSGGVPIYVVDAIKADPQVIPGKAGLYPGLIAEETARYPHLDGEEYLRIRRAIGADADLRRKLFADFFIRPNEIPDAFQAVADSLPADAELALALYPPSQAEVLRPLLSGRPRIAIYPIGDSWPLDVPAVERELAAIAAGHPELVVAFLGETTGDPSRQIETWLAAHLYRLSETWFEPVRVLAYASYGGGGQTAAIDVQFQDGITLQSATVIDPVASPGGVVRLQLRWTSAAPTSKQYKIFVHIFAGDRILAQHDGQAAGELRPTPTWQTGETILDQFAIRLPADARPGSYPLRIGLYDLASQERLHLMSGDEFFVGGLVTVK